MYVTNVTDDYNNITLKKCTDILNDHNNITLKQNTYILNDYNNITFCNCTNSGNIIDVIILSSLLTIPCGLSFLCLIYFMVHTLIKPLFNRK